MKEQSKELLPEKNKEQGKEEELALLKLKDEVEINEIQKEAIFKAAMIKTFMSIESLDKVPLGGQKIHYPKEIQEGELPDIIDIQPRVITKSVVSIHVILGKRIFDVEPVAGKVKEIYLTKEALVIKTSYYTATYGKWDRFPDLCRRLRKTPVGKWEKKWFRGSTVTEV